MHEALVDSRDHRHCPFKGNARYYSVFGEKDLAWYYLTPDERACKDLHNTVRIDDAQSDKG